MATLRAGADGQRASTDSLPDRYQDLGAIGRGGHGEVRRAWDSLMERNVAIKILAWDHVDEADPSGLTRFLHEARTTARLAHPGVVPVHERGVLEDGRPYFVMKEVVGRTFDQVIRPVHTVSDDEWREAEGWSLRRLVEALARVAETVAFAHEQRVVHRDLKPANLMVGAHGEVLVMDWGYRARAR